MPGKIADALIRGGLLGDFGRQALGAIDEAAVVGSSLGRSVLAGTNGLLRLAATGDPDAAAARVEEVENDPAFTYQPRTQEARENFQQVGGLISRASNAVANTKTGHSINDFLYEGSAQNPLLYAAAAGAMNLLGGPEGRAAKAAEGAAIREGLLRGMPETASVAGKKIAVAPVPQARAAAEAYKQRTGLGHDAPRDYVTPKPEEGARVAKAYDEMKHAPDDPEVAASYRAMIDETLDQWREIEKTGLKVEFIKPGMKNPYAESPRLAIEDLRDNNHLWVYPTESGFGSSAADVSKNPLLEMTDVEIDGRKLPANDVFRIVHDYFGHAKEGNGFRAAGEENAWRQHAAMYSEKARGAMTSETRGQNSWVNWGPHGEKNRMASGDDTVYADQKSGLLPREFWSDEALGLDKDRDVFTHENLLENPGRQKDIERYSPRKVPAYAQRLEENEDAFKQLTEWAKSGMNEEGLGWYNTEEMRQSFLKELGPAEGQRAYEMYIDLVAATSAGAKTPANAKIAGHYYYHGMRGNGAPMPVKGSGYGHKAQNLHNRGASEIVEGRTGLLAIQNPKRFTFAENLKGNWDHVTVDKHNVRALGMASRDPEFLATKLEDVKAAKQGRVQAPDWWKESQHGKWNPKTFSPRNWFAKHGDNIEWEKLPPTWFRGTPSKTDYASLERITKRLAKELGTTPAQAQAALWLGAGERTGLGSPPKAFAKIFHDRIKATAKRDGISQEQALRDVIRAKRMLGTADPNLLLRLSAGGGLVGLLGVAAGHTGRDHK